MNNKATELIRWLELALIICVIANMGYRTPRLFLRVLICTAKKIDFDGNLLQLILKIIQ